MAFFGALLFAVLALPVIFGTAAIGGSLEFRDLTTVMNSFVSLTVYVLPLLAVMAVSEAFASESEHGTLALMLTYPLVAHHLGARENHGLCGGAFRGLFLCGSNRHCRARGAAGYLPWSETLAASVKLLVTGWLYGLAYIALGCWVSLLVKTKAQALAVLVMLWFFPRRSLRRAPFDGGGGVRRGVSRTVLTTLMSLNCADAFRLINTVPEKGDFTAGAGLLTLVLIGWSAAGTALALFFRAAHQAVTAVIPHKPCVQPARELSAALSADILSGPTVRPASSRGPAFLARTEK